VNKLSIIGKGPGYERSISDQENGFDVWCPSTVYKQLESISVEPNLIFQLHERKLFETWIKEKQNKVVIIKPDFFYPDCIVFPAQVLVDLHGFRFGSSLAWMLAYSVELGYKEINVHGVHMSHETEYGIQRDTLFYFVGYAQGKGVKVEIDVDSGIFIGNQKYGIAGGE